MDTLSGIETEAGQVKRIEVELERKAQRAQNKTRPKGGPDGAKASQWIVEIMRKALTDAEIAQIVGLLRLVSKSQLEAAMLGK